MAYGARLESGLGAIPQGFKSPILRMAVPRCRQVFGRDTEQALLRGALAQTRERRGGFVLLTGPAGIGKSPPMLPSPGSAGRLPRVAAHDLGSYRSMNQTSGWPRRWWDRVPQPIATFALTAWSALPRAVRARFVPFAQRINPPQTTAAALASPGPDTVAGVADLRAQGFEPIEEHTGSVDVAELWPRQHRRWVEETRAWRLAHAECGGKLWLVRSPWPALGLQDALNVVWSWVEHDRAVQSSPEAARRQVWRERSGEALGWDEATALAWVVQHTGR